jgi:replication factor C subunit 2/4
MQWVEKYRPNNLDEVTSQNNIIQTLRKSLDTKNIPHLIFYGPSGCGKTSTILALAKEIFGKKYWTDRIIELNASDERGINIVRDKIKMYAKQSVNLNDDIPPWKIIILDEADTMTSDSQFALRRIMEEYSKVTRFCIICNYYNKIIDPLVSRCSLFCFKPISDNEIYNKLEHICKMENLIYSEYFLNKIIKMSRGDLRKAINFLQKCGNSNCLVFKEELLDEIYGSIPKDIFNELTKYIFNKDLENVDKIINQIYLDGYSLVNQIVLFHDFIIDSNFNSYQKSQIINKLSEIDQSLIKGCDEYIQFMRLVYYIINII